MVLHKNSTSNSALEILKNPFDDHHMGCSRGVHELAYNTNRMTQIRPCDCKIDKLDHQFFIKLRLIKRVPIQSQLKFAIQRCLCRFAVKHISFTQQIQHIFVLIQKQSFVRSSHLYAKKIFKKGKVLNSKSLMKNTLKIGNSWMIITSNNKIININ